MPIFRKISKDYQGKIQNLPNLHSPPLTLIVQWRILVHLMEKDGWTILNTGRRVPDENMRIDKELLDSLGETSAPILHFYEWEGSSATYGHFVKPEDFLNLDAAKKHQLQLAKRPTGGGIVLHDFDLAFSLLIPRHHPYFSDKPLDNYALVHRMVLEAVKEFLGTGDLLELIPCDAKERDLPSTRFCMARPTKYDLVVGERKIAGAAQRKTKKGFLHQGTIAMKLPPKSYLKEILLPNTQVLEAMGASTFPLLKEEDDLEVGRETMTHLLQKHITQASVHVTKT